MKYLQKISALLIAISLYSCGNEEVDIVSHIDSYPAIYPDYIGVTVPVNICPLNFDLQSYDYQKLDVTISCGDDELHYQNNGAIEIDESKWHKLLENHTMDSIKVEVAVKIKDNWFGLKPFHFFVDSSKLDYSVVYRRIAPAYGVFSDIGICQREISSFKETNIINSKQLQNACMNCHSFNRTNPDNMLLHIRGEISGTIYKNNDTAEIYVTKTDSTINNFAYSYYHPEGRYIVSSMNTTRQVFRTGHYQRLDVFDYQADIAVYDRYTSEILPVPHLKTEEYYEDFPVFSADGKKIYFSRCKLDKLPENFQKLKFNLCSVDFDAATRTIGKEITTVIDAKSINLSATEPRPSYDGKYIMFCMMEYGDFAIWHRKADLWIYNIEKDSSYCLTAANSPESEAYHNWSKDSKWFVFTSRRGDALYTQLYFAKMNPDGTCTKPFLLPQRNPKVYQDENTHSFNCPEFCSKPLPLNKSEIFEMAYGKERKHVKFLTE